MQKEIEAIILDVDPGAIAVKLGAAGAERAFKGILITTYFDDEERSYRRAGMRLRLRQFIGDDGTAATEYVLKRRTSNEGVRTSIEVPQPFVPGPDAHLRIARELRERGLEPIRHELKRRERYVQGAITYDLDRILEPAIPHFMEIEGPDSSAIIEAAERLGYRRDQVLPWTASDVLRHYGLLEAPQRLLP